MSKHIKLMASLANETGLYVYNMNTEATFLAPVVLNASPEPKLTPSEDEVYKFSNAESGWFASVGINDTERLSQVMQLEDGTLLLEVKPIKSYTAKDLAKAKPFVGGAK